MTTSRTVTILTGNLGRGVSSNRFEENLDLVIKKTPGAHRFFQFQEIDEADEPEEFKMIKAKLGDTHTFVGGKTNVPIAVPRSFKVFSRSATVASEGVDGLSPRRHVVQAVVHPDDHPDCKIVATNTHFARDASSLARPRREADIVLRQRLKSARERKTPLAAWLTADLNSRNYKKLGPDEMRLVTARLDYIRAYPAGDVKMKLLKTGAIDLSIDGHNAHWARVLVTWP